MAFEKVKTRFPSATIDANGVLTIPALGAGYPSKVALRVAAGIANQAGKVLTLDNPFPKPAVVTPPAVTLVSISLTGPLEVNEGGSAAFKVTGNYSNSTTALITSGISWGTNSPGGVFSPPANSVVGDGYAANITAIVDGKKAVRPVTVIDKTTPVVVVPVTLTSIGISGVNQQNEGTSQTLKLTAVYSDGTSTQPTTGIVWGNKTPNGVLAIPANSVVGDGHTETVTASFGGKNASFDVQVVDTTVVVPPSAEQVYGVLNYNPYWGYVLDTSNQDLTGFFDDDPTTAALDDNLRDNVDLGDSRQTTRPDIVFNFPKQLGMGLKEVWMGDGQHEASGDPMQSFTLTPGTFERVPAFTFDGKVGNNVWQKNIFPAPVRTDDFVMEWTYPIPTQMKFIGYFTPYTPAPYVPVSPPMKEMAGAVTYVYDELLPSAGPVSPERMAVADTCELFRLYLDTGMCWNADIGKVSLSPTASGFWILDELLTAFKKMGKKVVLCLKGDETSLHYKTVMKQLMLRYGPNANMPDSEFDDLWQGPGYDNHYAVNVIKKGLDLVRIFQHGNEPWRWWKNRAYVISQTNLEGYVTPEEYYFYCLKPCFDIAQAISPDIEVMVAGTPSNNPGIVQGIIHACRLHNGGKLCFHSVGYHDYINANGGQNLGGAPVGVPPEQNNVAYNHVMRFGQTLQDASPDFYIKKYITETGYSIANAAGSNPEQRAVPTATKDTFRKAADLGLRMGSECASAGLDGLMHYQLLDDQAYIYNSSRWVPWDTSNGIAQAHRDGSVGIRPMSDAQQQRTALVGDYRIVSTDRSNPLIRVHRLEKAGSSTVIYQLHLISHNDSTAPYALIVPAGKTATRYDINFGVMSKEPYPLVSTDNGEVQYFDRYTPGTRKMDPTPLATTNGAVSVTVSETPIWVVIN
jgi:hypothetical protein